MNRRRGDANWIRDTYTRTEFLLEEWGRWHRTDILVGPRPVISPLGQLRGSTVRTPAITDEQVETIDRSVAALGVVAPELWDVVQLVFRAGLPVAAAARDLGVAIDVLRYQRVPAAIRWISADLMPEPEPPPRRIDAVESELAKLLAETVGRPLVTKELARLAKRLRADPTTRAIWDLLRN